MCKPQASSEAWMWPSRRAASSGKACWWPRSWWAILKGGCVLGCRSRRRTSRRSARRIRTCEQTPNQNACGCEPSRTAASQVQGVRASVDGNASRSRGGVRAVLEANGPRPRQMLCDSHCSHGHDATPGGP
eukprot:6208927-Pleurochrysis_carterae.AAC.2